MKKSLLLAAALFATSQAFALDMYVIGSNVDGQEWALGTNQMTQTADGVYEWSGNTLASNFKINDGTWGADYNIGKGDDGAIKIGTPYHYYMGDGSGDIPFDGFATVSSPKVVLDMNAGTIVLTGTPEGETPEPGDLTFYIVGDNINGAASWDATPDHAFTDKGNGVYEWKGESLGSGFKINDGGWSNPDHNIGSSGAKLSLDEPYFYWANGNSKNIEFEGFAEVINPVVVLNLNDETITVTGDADGEISWYVAGINGQYVLDDNWILTENNGVFEREVYIVEEAGKFKVVQTGWANQFGTTDPESNFIDPSNMSAEVEPIDNDDDQVPYELTEGTYTFQWDEENWVVTFVASGDGVKTVFGANDGEAVYFNLHGQKVATPDKGIFVKVVNGKSVKVVK